MKATREVDFPKARAHTRLQCTDIYPTQYASLHLIGLKHYISEYMELDEQSDVLMD